MFRRDWGVLVGSRRSRSSVTVRRVMTTRFLKSLLLHLLLQDFCNPAAQSQGAPVTLRAPQALRAVTLRALHPQTPVTQRAPQAQRPTTLGVSKGLASPWCTTGPRGAGRRTATLIHWRSEPSLPGTNKDRVKLGSTYRKDLKPALQEPLENRKGSHQAKVKQPLALGAKKLLSPVRDPRAPEPVRVKEELQKRAETKDLPHARKRDLKRRAMDSPDEPSGKKKRGEI
ncbi:uncharacterized protein LOC113941970 [Corapipo altera]|uniref:uncharacterized protein LOC113941970 n=1 Tax=Corapipo altera TaxID=415028 RepID=UPI000FD6703D|nr:uncharacterized protein LOC113941970 [Corapipo altera]